MTTKRYRLPDGHEIEAEFASNMVTFTYRLSPHLSLWSKHPLTEVPPPVPDEPPPGAYLIGGHLAARIPHGYFDNWVCAIDGAEGPFWAWEPLCLRAGGPDVAIVPLVPKYDPNTPIPEWERELLDRQAKDRDEADELLAAVRAVALPYEGTGDLALWRIRVCIDPLGVAIRVTELATGKVVAVVRPDQPEAMAGALLAADRAAREAQ